MNYKDKKIKNSLKTKKYYERFLYKDKLMKRRLMFRMNIL